MTARWDAVIVGAGAAGLSLAGRLAADTDGGWARNRVLIVDDGSGDIGRRCWAYWSASPRAVDPAAVGCVGRLAMHAAGRSTTVPLGRYHYRVVTGEGLRRWARDRLSAAPAYVTMPGHVRTVSGTRDGAAVELASGERITASWVFDSRPRAGHGGGHAAADAPLTMAFYGQTVETERDVFDDGVVTFFDFRTDQHHAGCFVSLLPFGRRRALVEHVQFGRAPAVDGKCAVAAYLAEVLRAGRHRVLDTEAGRLPLGLPVRRRPESKVLRIGVAGGMLKPSTGYAFDRIQRDAAAVVRSLRRHGHPYRLPATAWRHRYLDGVLLRVLAREPGQLEQVFARLFAANPAERVLRFLDQDSTRTEETRLICGLRPAPFLRAALLP